MYIRFVTNELHPKSNQKLGIFHAIRYMHDYGELSEEEFNITRSTAPAVEPLSVYKFISRYTV